MKTLFSERQALDLEVKQLKQQLEEERNKKKNSIHNSHNGPTNGSDSDSDFDLHRKFTNSIIFIHHENIIIHCFYFSIQAKTPNW